MRNFLINSLCIVFLLCFANAANAQIKINEYSASNVNGPTDAFGERPDWVELYNAGGAPVSINGYFFSDNNNAIAKWQVPATPTVTIPAGGRIVIFCSGVDSVLPGGQVHCGFKLTQCHNEQIIISDASAVVIDSTTLSRTQADDSYGRIPDGTGPFKLFTTPSPNAVNTGGYTRYVAKPTMSIPPGYYPAAQTVSLACSDPNTTIHYTINGTAPTIASPIYSTPLNISATTPVRCMAVSTDPTLAASFVETNTYFINETHKFATLSICGTFTGAGGLFTSGNTIRQSVEFFDSSDNFKWETSGFAYKHGHDSWAFSQKGFRLSAEDEFGYTAELPEKFFANSTRDSFDLVILKGGASDNYPDANGWQSWMQERGAHMRDAFCQDFSIKYNMEFDERSYQPCVVFLNGQYWGVYEIRERVDLDYVEYYYDQPEKKVDMLRYWGGLQVQAGSAQGWTDLKNFIVNNDMTQPANLAIVDSQLNFISMIDFFIYNNYIANSDHMNWNTMWWRGRKGAGVKWRYALWDLDNTYNLGENYTGLSSTGADMDPCEPFTLFVNSNNIFHTQMINGLMTNPDFRRLYQDRYIHLLTTALNCDTLLKHLNYFENLLDGEMPQHIARWGGTYQKWQDNVDTIRKFILDRCALVASDQDTCLAVKKITFNVDQVGMGNIQVGTTTLPQYPYKTIAVTDSIYSINAVPNPGFMFVEWRKYKPQNLISPTMVTPNALLDYKQEDSIVAVFAIKPKDSFNVVVANNAPWAGTILVDGATTVGATPMIFRWEEATTHTLTATATNITKHQFANWTWADPGNNVLSPNTNTESVVLDVKFSTDTLIANYDTVVTLQKFLYLPNAFTPDGDGVNDKFGDVARFNPDMKAAQMQIVDRWGNVVFKGDIMNNAWDGTTGAGQACNADVYFYHLVITLTDNKKYQFKGDIQLLRQ
jgi:gliding motility-associated-like protein